jgi:transketolase
MLLAEGIDVRVVSLPALDRFDSQSESYKDETFANDYDHRIFLEMGKSDALYKYAKYVLGIDRFGASAPAEDVIKKLGYTPEAIVTKILAIVKK